MKKRVSGRRCEGADQVDSNKNKFLDILIGENRPLRVIMVEAGRHAGGEGRGT